MTPSPNIDVVRTIDLPFFFSASNPKSTALWRKNFSRAKTQLTKLVVDKLTEFIKTNKELKELYGDEDNWYNMGNVKIINFAPANWSKGKRHDNRT